MAPPVCVSQPTTPPLAQCHNVTVSTGLNTCAVASASINNGSSDPDGDPLTFTQTPAGPYGLGTTSVSLTVSDRTLSSQCRGTVTVVDGQAPTLTCPTAQTATASNSSGAPVTFSPTASDNCGTAITLCTPSSGSIFPLGTTPVTCTATDGAGIQSSCGFTVTVTTDALTQLNSRTFGVRICHICKGTMLFLVIQREHLVPMHAGQGQLSPAKVDHARQSVSRDQQLSVVTGFRRRLSSSRSRTRR